MAWQMENEVQTVKQGQSKKVLINWISNATNSLSSEILKKSFDDCTLFVEDPDDRVEARRANLVENLVQATMENGDLWNMLLSATEEDRDQAFNEALNKLLYKIKCVTVDFWLLPTISWCCQSMVRINRATSTRLT